MIELTKSFEDWKQITQSIQSTSFLQSAGFWRFAELQNYTVLALADKDENGKYKSYCLAYIVKAKRGKYLAISHGPVFQSNIIDEDKFQLYIDKFSSLAKENSCIFIRLAPPWPRENNLFKGFIQAPIHLHAEQTIIIDLKKSDEQLLSEMRKSTRSLIRKANILKNEGALKVNWTNIVTDEMYKVYKDTTTRGGFSGYTKEYLQQEFDTFKETEKASILTICYQNKVLSWGIFLYVGNHTFYHHGANLITKEVPSAYLFYWEGIQRAKVLGMIEYDLWGISPKYATKHPWKKISLFKSGFGGRYTELEKTQDKILSPLYFLTYLFEKIRAFRRGF